MTAGQHRHRTTLQAGPMRRLIDAPRQSRGDDESGLAQLTRQLAGKFEPGTANTSRPCSAAMRAVISDPERRAASTTTTPSEVPEISRLRRGKSRARGT